MIYDDIHYEISYIARIRENVLSESFFQLRNQEKNFSIKSLALSDIDSLTKDSPIHLLRALYTCKSFAICKENGQSFINEENASEILGYKSDFANMFIFKKDSLNENYLNARKALYKTMMQLRDERFKDYKREQISISQLSHEEYTQEKREQERILIEKQRQTRLSSRNTTNKDSQLILESNDKSSVIIFLDSDNSLSNLIHIHNSKIDIFTKDKSIIDIQELINNYKDYGITLDSLHSANTQTFLYSHLLIGSKEVESNPLYFGELDSNSYIGLDETKPIYYLETNDEIMDTSNTESNNALSTLNIFLDSSTLTLLNYSLLDSSLNIKLELLSKESKAILDKEKALRDKQKEQKSKAKDSRNDDMTSTAMLHPILEDNDIKCPHNGVVKLKSNKGKSFKSKDIPMILESDLINSQIIGCTNNILGVPTPCSLVSIILPSARGLKKFNDDYPIMQDLVSSGVFSDKGFPLIATPKPNTFRINSPNPSVANTQNEESIESSLKLIKPMLRLHYKVNKYQKDSLPIYRIKLQDEIIESSSDMPLNSLVIDINKDCKDIEDKALQTSLLVSYPKDYTFKQVGLQLDSNALILIFLIPQKIPKIYKEAYKQYQDKDYGVGKYKYLYEYCHHKNLDIEDYAELGLNKKASSQYQFVLLAPAKANKILVELANGLDSIIESKDREQNLETLLTLKLINGGYKEKYWSFGEEIEEYTQKNLLQTDTESKDSKEAQDKQDKQILEMYFSYGEDKVRVDSISRHYVDLNLHIKTQGYNDGEIVEVRLESSTHQTFIASGIIQNNETIIENMFKDK